jgi:RHS repeat-associated protein
VAALVVVTVLWLGAWAPAAGAATLSQRWPSPSLAGLRSWLAGPGPAARLPAEAMGHVSKAARMGRQVPSAVTRAGRGRGRGRAPGRGRGQLPLYRPHAVRARRDVTPTEGTAGGFSLKSSRLVSSAMTATSDLYKNANGTYTRLAYAGQVNYRDGSGGFRPIRTALVPAAGGWREQASSLPVRLARQPGPAALLSAGLGGGRELRMGLAGALPVTGRAAGSTVTYPGVLPGTTVTQTALDAGADTTITLDSPAAPSSWVFPLRLRGLTAVPAGGAVSLRDAGGAVAWRIGEGLASAAVPAKHPGAAPATVAAAWRLTPYDGGQALRLSLPSGWLSKPGRAFPVTVRITSSATGTAPSAAKAPALQRGSGRLPDSSSDNQEGATGTTFVQGIGNTTGPVVDNSHSPVTYVGFSDGETSNTFMKFGDLGTTSLEDYQILTASLHVYVAEAGSCSQEPWDVYPVTDPGWALDSVAWPGPGTGSSIGESDVAAPGGACSGGTGGYISDQLSTGVFNGWTLDGSKNHGLAVETPSSTDASQWKELDGYYSDYPPYLELTYAQDVAPQINNMYPQNDYDVSSLTPRLLASGADPDSWPDPLTYQFAVYDSSGNLVACSTPSADNGCEQTSSSGSDPIGKGWISSSSWEVTLMALRWGQVYEWVVQDYDGLDTGTSATHFLITQVPQPTITSATQNSGAQGITPGSGDYTTNATDAQVSAVGPALAIQRYYDSGNASVAGAFGTGWSSILDMRVTGIIDSPANPVGPDTAVVTYPDGEQVAFGENLDGSYSPPQGRYATLTYASGSYTLTDKKDTTYTFSEQVGSGVYGLTSITDALGNTERFTWNTASPPEITGITSVAWQRSLTIAWTTPPGAGSPHVSTVTTDPVVTNGSGLAWSYAYSGDALTGVCSPASSASCAGQAACPAVSGGCTAYSYTQGTGYFGAVLNTGPRSYWPLGNSSGQSASSTVLANEGTDDGTYHNVTLGQAGPVAGSAATAGSFNGTSSYVQMPDSLVPADDYQSISVWFKTTTAGGVLFGSSGSPLGSPDMTAYTPNLYVGENGDLLAEFWTGGVDVLSTPGQVTDGQWHQAVLTASGDSQTLYLDGAAVATRTSTSGPVDNAGLTYDSVGAGMIDGTWPDQPGLGPAASYFTGDIAGAGIWDRPLTAAEVSGLYQLGTMPESELSGVTRPSGSAYSSVSYNAVNGSVTQVTDDNGGTWKLAAPTVAGSSQVYVSAVLGQGPSDYWRLADTDTTQAINQVDGGTATFSDVTQGVAGPFSDSAGTSFNGTSSYLQLPQGLLDGGASQSVSMWFRTNGPGQVLLGYSQDPVTAGSTMNGFVPALYVGTGGDLHGEFWDGQENPVVSSSPVDDGKWHNVVLTTSSAPGNNGSGETMYLDGKLAGTIAGGAAVPAAYPYGYVGAGFLGSPWPDATTVLNGQRDDPVQGTPSSYFDGSVADVAVYNSQLTAAQVTEEYSARNASGGLTPVETAGLTDPGLNAVSYQLDPLNGDRVIAQTDGLGNTTRYGYDTAGFEYSVTDPNGNMTITGHDIRGNLTSQATCQDQALNECSTAYYSYYPDDTSPALAPDPRNDLPLTARGPGSSSGTDDTYLTSYAYNSSGELASQTGPPVAGFPGGRRTTYTYTTTATPAYKSSGQVSGTTPAGLPLTQTSPGGAVTSWEYYSDGDVYQVTDPDGLTTAYTYDGLGRVLTKTVTSDSYPSGLTTTYAYDAMGDVVTETDPPVTDSVTSATHTAQITTAYDDDGDMTSQTVADLTGGDASRQVLRTYNDHDQLASSTDAAPARTTYTYDAYGNLASETDAMGDVTSYTYDPDGDLLTTTLDNYTGSDPKHPQPPAPLVESSRDYDPAGRLAAITSAMGFTTAYTYTDDGLLATQTRCTSWTATAGCVGSTYTEQSNSYNAAGQLTSQVTNNGHTTTDYTPDAAGRTTSVTVDPGGLDRTASYTYTPDDAVASQVLTGSSGAIVRSASYTYDPMGNLTSQSQYLPGSGGPDGWWQLTQPSGTTVPDASGTGNTAVADAVSWSGNAGTFNGSTSQVATAGPVVDTTGSFTVSAWVNPSAATAWAAAVSQDASQDSGFQLQYDATTGGWAFGRKNQDIGSQNGGGPVSIRAVSSGDATLGSWQYLTATYDAAAGLMTLYVNGTAQGTATDSTPYASAGPLVIGRGQYSGTPTDYFSGSISDVQAYQRVLSAGEVSALYGLGRNKAADPTGQLTTKWTLDQRGLATSMTDPDQNTTYYRYDQAGQLVVTTDPVVTAQSYGQAAAQVAPVTMTGYDTFGDPVVSEDANGNETQTGYDGDGRVTSVTLPSYTPPDGSGTIAAATTSTTYNGLGEVTSQTDPRGNITTYTYDQLGDVTSQTDPGQPATYWAYDADGDQLKQTTPTGAVTSACYDFLGRPLQVTQQERYPATQDDSTTYSYGTGSTPGCAPGADDNQPWPTSQTTQDGVTTSYTYDNVGEVTGVTNNTTNTTGYAYDAAGDMVKVTYPAGEYSTAAYDQAGRQTGEADYSAGGTQLRSESAAYDDDGNMLSATDYRGNTATFTYDALDRLASQTQPVSPTSAITTSFGYDAAGNPTLYTDGSNNNWWATYNSWNLQESAVEPPTQAAPTAADGTFTTSYDKDGNPVTLSEPGGVTVTSTYNDLDELTGQAGTGADAPTASRSFTYDDDGNLTSASTPGGTDSFTYDDRGLMLSATGPSGSSSFTYNGDSLISSETDAAGTTSYTYDTDDRLGTLSDPATGNTLTYGYNADSQVSRISYGAGGDTQSFAYNGLRELTSDTLDTGSGVQVASISYGYDNDGNITTQDATGIGAATNNTYTYDQAGRLNTWDNGTTTISYGYDLNGNRVRAGSVTSAYNARDELTSDGTSTYSYTMRGTLASVTGPSGTAAFTSDAYGQAITQDGQAYAYDALGRVTSGTGSGTSAAFSYLGDATTLASDGTSTYTWDPSGTTLTGIGVAGGSPSAGVLALTDQHADVVANFTASGKALSGSASYDPLGNVLTSSGMQGDLGYQSGWTDPANGRVDMSARWYDPAAGSFTSPDTASPSPVPDEAAASPYAYAGDNPVTAADPTGHWMAMMHQGGGGGSRALADSYEAEAPSSCGGFFGGLACDFPDEYAAADRVYHVVVKVITAAPADVASLARQTEEYLHQNISDDLIVAGRLARDLKTGVQDAATQGVHALGDAWHDTESASSGMVHSVTRWAAAGARDQIAAVRTSLHDVATAATATADFVKSHANAIEVGIVSAAVFLGCEAVLGVATGGVGAVAGAVGCGMLAGAVSGALSYGVQAVQTHTFSWQGLAQSVAAGGVIGAVGGFGGGLLGKAGSAISSLLTDGAASDAATTADSLTADGAASTRSAAAADPADTITASSSDAAPSASPADNVTTGGESTGSSTSSDTGSGSQGQVNPDTRAAASISTPEDVPAIEAAPERPALPAGQRVPYMASPVRSFVTVEDSSYYRVFSGDRNVGSFLTGVPPASADQAVAGLALPPSNAADFVQEVMVPAGTRLQSSIANPAFGQPGGMLQFELLERIPIKNFGEGVPFR